MRQRIGGGQIIARVSVHSLFPPAQQNGTHQRHKQIPRHLDGCGGKIEERGPDNRLMRGKKVCVSDDKHDGRVLEVDDEVIADLGHDATKRLRQDHARHGLPVRHTDGLRALGLARIDRENAAAHGLRHICARVDGDDDERREPNALPLYGVIRKIGQAVIDEHRLKNHRRTAKDFDIGANDAAQ